MAGLARGACALFAVLALFLAPIIVSLTHSPAAAMAAEVESRHGHPHGGADDGLSAGHDATDHEHQVTALLPNTGDIRVFVDDDRDPALAQLASGAIREGPRRPPRHV
mgnify:CR=1 FL=1